MSLYVTFIGVIALTLILSGLLPLLANWRMAPAPELARRLRELRRAHRLTYSDLAQRTGISARHLAEVEHELRTVSDEHLEALAKAFGVSLYYLTYNRAAASHHLFWHRRSQIFRLTLAGLTVAINTALLWLLAPRVNGPSSVWLMSLPAACVAGLLLWLRRPVPEAKAPHIQNAGLILVFANQMYALVSISLAWLAPQPIAILHAVAVSWNAAVTCLSIFNQLWPRDERNPPPLPLDVPEVAAVIPTYGEPVEVLEQVVQSVVRLTYPADKIHVYLSDDGRRPEVAQLAERYGIGYLLGPQQDAKAGNLNQALAAIQAAHPDCDLLLTQDADDTLAPGFLQAVVGYFSDSQVAFVQTPKDCIVPSGDLFGNREHIFFRTLQAGRNGANAAFACGSGVMWRISALQSIGGFSTWNLVEDLTTSYHLHSAGFTSRYHNEVFSVGLAPDDIPGILKQRGTWAVDTLRLFLFDNPLWKQGKLSLRQRMQYLEQGFFYLTSALITPFLFAVPVLALFTGLFITNAAVLALVWSASVCANIYYYGVVSDSRGADVLRTWQYIMGHSPTYLRALWTALHSRDRKPTYVVTRKTRVAGFYGHLLWPQFAAIAIGAMSIVYGVIAYGATYPWHVAVNCAFVAYYIAMLWGICKAAFYGVAASELPAPVRTALSWRRSLTKRQVSPASE
jgi:cellulose synthase (UDP-forming)